MARIRIVLYVIFNKYGNFITVGRGETLNDVNVMGLFIFMCMPFPVFPPTQNLTVALLVDTK
jgi:hypothetical protein